MCSPDLDEPHLLRPLANVRIASVHGSGVASHFVCVGADGTAYIFGRALGGPVPEGSPQRVRLASAIVQAAVGRAHTVLVCADGTAFSAGSNNVGQVRARASHVCQLRVDARLLQCGHSQAETEIHEFRQIISDRLADEKVVKASAGTTFSLLLTESGKGASARDEAKYDLTRPSDGSQCFHLAAASTAHSETERLASTSSATAKPRST